MPLQDNHLTGEIISAAIEVHRTLGPGLLEKAYKDCLAHELQLRRAHVQTEVPYPIEYKSLIVEKAYRVDSIAANEVVVEVKATQQMHPVYEAQLLTYLRVTGLRLGLLMNFGMPTLEEGLVRRIL